MTSRKYTEFTGLDVRRALSVSDEKSARVAENLYLTSGKTYRTRPGTRVVGQLPEESVGLYTAANGKLRTLVPAGYADIYAQQGPRFTFDFVGDGGTAYPRDDLEELTGIELFGSSVTQGTHAYAAVRRKSTGRVEHHYLRDRPDTDTDVPDTLVSTPFAPEAPLVKAGTKLWAPNRPTGGVWFSSTELGPTNWTEEQDAGFLPVLQHATGSTQVQALGIYRDRLVVFYADSVQVWAIDPDPLNHFLTEVLNGPGTLDRPLVSNMLGDLIFFSRGGFRSLSRTKITGEMVEADIGSRVRDLTEPLDQQGTASVWWQQLGVYIAAFGSTCYVFKFDPENKVTGWTTWVLPSAVEAFAVADNQLYYRDPDGVVREFDLELDNDSGTRVAWSYRGQFHHMGSPGRFKSFDAMNLYHTGVATYAYLLDPRDESIRAEGFEVDGVTRAHERLPLVSMAESIAIELSGNGSWDFSGYALHYQQLGE